MGARNVAGNPSAPRGNKRIRGRRRELWKTKADGDSMFLDKKTKRREANTADSRTRAVD
jgi:hypothetical protein